MLTFYKFRVDNGMLQLSEVPNPYQNQMRLQGYTDTVEEGEDE
ncbi:hypothetical protein [Paenibacillus sp. NRS-1760]